MTAFAAAGQDPVRQAETERLRTLVEAGAMPRSALDRALEAEADRADDEILRATLSSSARIEDATARQADDIVGAARRRLDRELRHVEKLGALIKQGLAARTELDAVCTEIDERRRTLDLALSRADFLRQVAEMARREQESDALANMPYAQPETISEHFEGTSPFSTADWKKLVLAFEKHFGKPVPVSAAGGTAVHRTFGFDHRGRYDVAVGPDQPEGVWLRHYLEQQGIPFYAFRTSVTGKATAAHIHVGPPSPRLRAAD